MNKACIYRNGEFVIVALPPGHLLHPNPESPKAHQALYWTERRRGQSLVQRMTPGKFSDWPNVGRCLDDYRTPYLVARPTTLLAVVRREHARAMARARRGHAWRACWFCCRCQARIYTTANPDAARHFCGGMICLADRLDRDAQAQVRGRST